ncbi:hypothetical protein JYT82_00365 [bacterium AH-315-K20]|nr:hypothetical protein [bacterium AH-315-K20]
MSKLSEIDLRATRYADRYDIRLDGLLGSGKDGTVWNTNARTALKVFKQKKLFCRELAAYLRLRQHHVINLCGHRVPQLLESDVELHAIEMSIVQPPFVLDFASVRLDRERVEFPQHVMDDEAEHRREMFGEERLPKIAAILSSLQRLGIHMTDIHPGNIAFENPASA